MKNQGLKDRRSRGLYETECQRGSSGLFTCKARTVARIKMMIKVMGFLFIMFLVPPYLPALALQCDSEGMSLSVKSSKQENAAWCWAASAQIVMDFHHEEISQCDIVNKIFQSGDMCCGISSRFNTTCSRGGSPARVFTKYNFTVNTVITGPTNRVLTWDQLTNQICNNGPFIFGVRYKDGGRHLFVVRGYRKDPDGQQIVEVNDLWDDEFSDYFYEEFVGDSDPESSNFGYTHIRDYIDIVKIQ